MPSPLFRFALAVTLITGASIVFAQPDPANDTFGLSVTSAGGVVTAHNQGPADLGVVVTLPSGTETIDTSQTTIKTTVPPYSRVTLARIRPMRDVNPAAVDVAVGWRPALGRLNASPKTDYPYSLPYSAGTERRVTQGPDKPWFSHQGSHVNAIDFDLPEGTPVLAARSGVVVHTVDRYSAGGTDADFVGKANNVYVEHADGTVAMYSHLRQGGVAVSVGQLVRAGNLLGYSGNTGYSNRPHLHFEVMRLDAAGYNRLDYVAIPVKFQVESGGRGTTILTGQTVKSVAPGDQVETPADPHLRSVVEEPEAAPVSVPVAMEPETAASPPAVTAARPTRATPPPTRRAAPQVVEMAAPSAAPQETGGIQLDKGALAIAGLALAWVALGKWSLWRAARDG